MTSIKTNRIIWVMMFASLLLGFFTNFTYAPTPIRLCFSGAMLFCLFYYPYNTTKNNDFDKFSNFILKAIFALTLFAVLRSAFFNTSEQVVGNKWITMFGNPECMFMMLAPCFAYLGCETDSVKNLKNATSVFLLLGTFGVFVLQLIPPKILWVSIVFYPYVEKKYRFLIIISIIMSLFSAFYAEETSRTSILIIFYVVSAYLLVYVLKNKSIIKLLCYGSIIIPTFYSVLTLLDPSFSIIQVILDKVLLQTGNTSLSTDTRTFLFWEIAEDLSKNDAWLFGKGAYSHYFSTYFYNLSADNGDYFLRIGCEVTLLQNLLRGGIIYATLYCSLIGYSVYNALKKGKSKFIESVAVVASGWYFVSCMSYLNGCDFKHLGFFLLVGMCLSAKWLNKTDDEIKQILK